MSTKSSIDMLEKPRLESSEDIPENFSQKDQKSYNEILQKVVEKKAEEVNKLAAKENRVPTAITIEEVKREVEKIFAEGEKPINTIVDVKNIPGSENSQKTTRRGFLKWLAGGALGLAGAEAGRRIVKNSTPDPEMIDSEYPNMVRVEGQGLKANYQIVHSDHDIQNDPGTLKNADYAILELVHHYGNDDYRLFADAYIANVESEDYGGEKQYGKVIRQAYEDKKPLYFVDMSNSTYEDLDIDTERLLRGESGVISMIEAALGVGLGAYATKKYISKEKTRRDFLKMAGATVATTYLMTPFAEHLTAVVTHRDKSENVSEHSFGRKAGRALQNVNASIHPEINKSKLIDLRNALMAEKSEFVAGIMQRELEKKPVANIYIGAKHIGIEQELLNNSETRLEKLRTELGKNFKNEGTIIRIDFTGNLDGRDLVSFKIIQDPSFVE